MKKRISALAICILLNIGMNESVTAQKMPQDWRKLNARISELMDQVDLSRKAIEKLHLAGHNLKKNKGPILYGKLKGKTIWDEDQHTHYTFYKNEPILIRQSNPHNLIDPSGESLAAIRKQLQVGGQAVLLDHVTTNGHIEYLYADQGISFIISRSGGNPVAVLIFKPTTVEEYKKLFWDKPEDLDETPAR